MIDVTFKLPEAGAMMKKLGLDQRGEVQRVIAEEALGLCDSIVPFRSGMLKQSGHVENNGECIGLSSVGFLIICRSAASRM